MANLTEVSLEDKVLDFSEVVENPKTSNGEMKDKQEDSKTDTIEKNEKEVAVNSSSSVPSTNENDNQNENSKSKPATSNSRAVEEKRTNGVKSVSSNSKVNVLGNQLPLNSDTWTVTNDSQIWLECCQNSLRSCGSNVRTFPSHSSKLNNQVNSSNHLYTPIQGTGPQGHRNANTNSMNYGRNSQYFVDLHVNPGETIQFDRGSYVELIQGPATVRMVSSNSTPPVPMPVQVPPGHMVQQIVDEHGTLRHIIVSPQPPVAVPVGNPYNGTAGGSVQSAVSGSAPFYLYHHPSYSIPHQFPPHLQTGLGHQGLHPTVDPIQMHQTNGFSSTAGMSESSNYVNSFKDERTQRQIFRLKKRLEARHKDAPSSSQSETSVKIAEDISTNESNEIQSSTESSEKKVSEKELLKLEALSSMKIPTVSDITSTSALLEWKVLELHSEDNCDIDISELQYNLLLCDKNSNAKPKLIYCGKETKFNSNDLKPATSYSAQVQAMLNNLTGTSSEGISFKTLSSKPCSPLPPRLLTRTKTTISLKWNAAVDNGAKISAYILEYDEGTGTNNFVELFNGLQKQYKTVKLKASTCYRFRIAAVNEHGQSDFSSISCFSTSGSTPSQPNPPTLKEAFVTALYLEWEQRPNDDNYILQMDDERTLHGFLPVYNGRETLYKVTQLTHNTSYKFRLGATNDEGPSPWSQVVNYSTQPDKPSKPGKPYLKGRPHSTFLKIAWDAPKEDGGCPVTEYVLQMDSGKGFESVHTGEELEHVCENLLPGMSYYFRVYCSGLGGKSDFSDVGSVMTLPVVPGKCEPPKVHGKPKALSINLKWAYPEYNGGSEVLECEIEVTNPDDTTRLAYRGPGTDCVVAGLLPGRKYIFKVKAYNKVGCGHWSDALEVMSGAAIADSPTGVQAVSRSPHTMQVSWTEPFHNGAPISEYRLECKCKEKDFELVYAGLSCSAEVKSLIPATVYYFQVQAVNAAGSGPFSEKVSCQTAPSSPGPVSTANIKAIMGSSTIALSWKEPNNHGSPILSYSIEVGDGMHTTDGDNPNICIEGLTPEATYKVRIQAINSVGPGPISSTLKLVTRGLPPLPPVLECCTTSCNSLRLKWGDGKNLDLKTFTLEMESPQAKRFIPVYQGPGLTFKVTKLQEITQYSFRIYASNEEGDGPCSDVFSFTTQRTLPPSLKAPKVSNVTQTTGNIEWMSCKAIGDDMLSYRLQLGTKETDFNVLYSGMQTSYSLQHLRPGREYSVRVSAVRNTSDGELPGPYSPSTVFCTTSVASVESQPPRIFSMRNMWKNREPLSDEQWAVIILCAFTMAAFCVAIVIQQILS